MDGYMKFIYSTLDYTICPIVNIAKDIVIHYRFVGYIEIPSNADNYKADTRQGVAVECLTA